MAAQGVGEVFQVGGVVSVRPVLVLHLHGQYRPAPGGEPLVQRGQEPAEVVVDRGEELRVAAAQPHGRVGQEP